MANSVAPDQTAPIYVKFICPKTYNFYSKLNWATTRQNMSLGVSNQARHKPACAATEAS